MDETYSARQIEKVLEHIGFQIVSETDTNFLCLCQFHKNTDTPSFSISKASGLAMCFNMSCDYKGNLIQTVIKSLNTNPFAAKRLINSFKDSNTSTLAEDVEALLDSKEDFQPFSIDVINRMHDDFWNSPAHEYMTNRGYTDKTLSTFQIGYSKKQNMVAIPYHTDDAMCVGIIGRSIVEKHFKNSKKLPTSKLLFNLHRAKKVGEKVIIVESATDVMRLWQLGYNAIATCGGFFTESQSIYVNKYFNEILIGTDNENPEDNRHINCHICPNTCKGHRPGRAIGFKVEERLPNKRLRWLSYDYGIIYPNKAKDIGDMTDEEIHQCIENAITDVEYNFWRKEFPELAII